MLDHFYRRHDVEAGDLVRRWWKGCRPDVEPTLLRPSSRSLTVLAPIGSPPALPRCDQEVTISAPDVEQASGLAERLESVEKLAEATNRELRELGVCRVGGVVLAELSRGRQLAA